MTLLPVEEAQARLLAMAQPLASETAALDRSAGRWLAEDITALRSQPAHDLSAMDGYAIRHADWPGPWTVQGESAAGAGALPTLAPGEAMRIFTGAPLPPGADTVLIQENVNREGNILTASPATTTRAGENIRLKASDFGQGQLLLESGTLLSPQAIALAAIAGHGGLPVGRRPRIALLSSGSELDTPAGALATGKLPASNGPMLQALLGSLAEVHDRGIVADTLDATTQAIWDAAGFDMIVTTGGASVGDYDLVGPAFRAAGGTLDFWRIRMRPGKPLMAGRLGDALFLGLPGNPVSAFVTAKLFLLPVIKRLSGDPAPLPAFESVPLASDLGAGGERDEYLRGRFEKGVASVLPTQDSAGLLALSRANCLLLRRAGQAPLPAGAGIDMLRL